MKKTFILVPIVALGLGGGVLLAGNAVFPQAEQQIEVKMDAAEQQVEQAVANTLNKVGVPSNIVQDDDQYIESSAGYVDVDDDFREVPTNIITADEAIDIAKQHAKGTMTDIELDQDYNGAHYEIEFQDGHIEYTINLNAVTGDVVYVEEDRD
mgnify:FL=1